MVGCCRCRVYPLVGHGIAKDTVAPLLGEAADPEVARNIRRIVMESDHIVGVHDMIIHNYGAGRSIASLHAEVRATRTLWLCTRKSTRPKSVSGSRPVCIWSSTWIRSISIMRMSTRCVSRPMACSVRSTALTMHDFRVVDGKRQINLIFDVVVPFSYDDDAKRDLLMKIYDGLKAIDSAL